MAIPQELRFCIGVDGTGIAYARTGRGTPIVKAANWLTHVELDLLSPPWQSWIEEVSRIGQLVRYDERKRSRRTRTARIDLHQRIRHRAGVGSKSEKREQW